MIVLSFVNQKGGVGKSTLCTNIAATLARDGARVLLIDADPQGSSLDWASARQEPGLVAVVGLPRASLHREIKRVAWGYDYVCIDGPPRVTDIARSAILASHIVAVPVQPSPYDIWASEEVVNLLLEAANFAPRLRFCFTINRKIANTAISREALDALAAYPVHALQSTVTQRVIFPVSASSGRAVYEVDPAGPAAAEIDAVLKELLAHAHGQKSEEDPDSSESSEGPDRPQAPQQAPTAAGPEECLGAQQGVSGL